MKPRVFVSSVIDGFHGMREAARRGIDAADCEPVLVNEDFPSSPESPRNACLNAVESSDVYLVLVGARGGSESPSGKPVVEEELDHAITRKRPVLAFLQDVARDPAAARLADRLSDYVHGSFRTTFSTEPELEKQVEDALKRIGLDGMKETNDPESVTRDLKAAKKRGRETILRFVLRPERREEVFDVVKLESENSEMMCCGWLTKGRYDSFVTRRRSTSIRPRRGSSSTRKLPREAAELSATSAWRFEWTEASSLTLRSPGWRIETTTSAGSGFRKRRSGRRCERPSDSRRPCMDSSIATCATSGTSMAPPADIDNRQLVSGPPTSTMTTGFSIRKDPISSGQPRLVSRADLEQPDREIEMITAFFHRGFDQ